MKTTWVVLAALVLGVTLPGLAPGLYFLTSEGAPARKIIVAR